MDPTDVSPIANAYMSDTTSGLLFDHGSLLLAAAPPLAGRPAPAGTTAAPGAPASSPPAAAMDASWLYIPLGLMAVLVVVSMLGQRKERKRREALLGAVKKHDRVQTIGGVIGSVVEVKPDTVVLKVDENSNVRMTFARSAVQQILKEAPESAEAT